MNDDLANAIRKVYIENDLNAKEYVRVAQQEGRMHQYDNAAYYRARADGLFAANLNMLYTLKKLGLDYILKGE